MTYVYDAGSSTPGYAGLIECNGVRVNSAIPSGSLIGGTFKLDPGCPLFGTGPVRLPTTPLPSDHGATIGVPYIDGWPFTLPGWLWVPSGPDDVPAAEEQLKAAFSAQNGLLTLTLNKRGWTSKRQMTAQLDGSIGPFDARHGILRIPTRNFQIPMFAADPLQYNADTLQAVTIALGGSGTVTNVTNNGNTPAPFVLRITGPITNPIVARNFGAGPSIALQGTTIASGHWIEIGTNTAAPGGVYAVDDTGANVFNLITTYTAPTVWVGTNGWFVVSSGTGVGTSVVMTFRDAWS